MPIKILQKQTEETVNMIDLTSAPNFDELASYIEATFFALRAPYMQWANLARRVIQGLPFKAYRLTELETYINTIRAELRKAVLVASEHFTEEQLELLRNQARMSKYAWKTLKKNRAITTGNGFTLVSY
jgi:hypothetical protein